MNMTLVEMYCRERFGLPESWALSTFEGVGDPRVPEKWDVKVTGSVVVAGPRGHRRWTDEMRLTYTVRRDEFLEWLEAWGVSTGKCMRCNGLGQEWAGWSSVEGTRYRVCTVCAGDGKYRAGLW